MAHMRIEHRILRKQRKDSLVAPMHLYESCTEGCEDTRKNNTGRSSTKELSEAKKVKRLEHKIVCLKQENEFLKKQQVF